MSSLLLIPSFLGPLVTGLLLGASRDRRGYRWIWGLFLVAAIVWVGAALAFISQLASAVDGRIVSAAMSDKSFFDSVWNVAACRWLFFCLPSIPVFVTALLWFPRRNA